VSPGRKKPSLPLAIAQATIMAAAVWLFLQPLATGPGLVVAIACTYAAYLGAYIAARVELRIVPGLAIGLLLVVIGVLGARVILAQQLSSATTTIVFGDAVYLGLGCAGILFGIRVVGERVHALAILEVAVVIGSVSHTFADHRHQRIHQPRFLSDWAWSSGIDPQTVLASLGIAAVVISLFMLLRGQRRTLHTRIAEAIERLRPEAVEREPERSTPTGTSTWPIRDSTRKAFLVVFSNDTFPATVVTARTSSSGAPQASMSANASS